METAEEKVPIQFDNDKDIIHKHPDLADPSKYYARRQMVFKVMAWIVGTALVLFLSFVALIVVSVIVFTWDGKCADEDIQIFAVFADAGYPDVSNDTEYDGFLWNGLGVLETAGCTLESLGGDRPVNGTPTGAFGAVFEPGELPDLFRGDVRLTRDDVALYTLSWTADALQVSWRDFNLEVTSVWSCPNDDVGQIQEEFTIVTGVDETYSEYWNSMSTSREGNGRDSVTCTSSSNGTPGQFLRSMSVSQEVRYDVHMWNPNNYFVYHWAKNCDVEVETSSSPLSIGESITWTLTNTC